MPATVTLADLVSQFRYRTQTNTSDPSDTVVKGWIAADYRKLYDEIANAGQDAYVPWTTTTITTASGTGAYNLPTDFYRMKGVTINFGTFRQMPIYEVRWAERAKYLNAVGWGYAVGYGMSSRIGYSIVPKTGATAAQVSFLPLPDGIYSVNVDYMTLPTVPTADSDVIDTINGWDEFLICSSCVRFAVTEETDATGWVEEREEARRRIIEGASSRNETEPYAATDVENAGYWQFPYPWYP